VHKRPPFDESGPVEGQSEAEHRSGGWFVRLPRPVRRFAAHAPGVLYDLGLGWLFGRRFLLLTHRGRRSGKLYRTMVEVLQYDAASREATVLSGTGPQADWYRNVQANPPVEVRISRDSYVPEVCFLDMAESRAGLREFNRRHPVEGRVASWLGMDGKPLVIFRPKT
jgi:deazaflavin-dependent oxidoreductase (nitroreductase family)